MDGGVDRYVMRVELCLIEITMPCYNQSSLR